MSDGPRTASDRGTSRDEKGTSRRPHRIGRRRTPELEWFQVETSPGRIRTVRPEREVLPPGIAPGRFPGYLTFHHGLAVAFGVDHIGYVKELPDGRARVYDTDAPAFLLSDRAGQVVDRSQPTAISRSRFTKLRRPSWFVADQVSGGDESPQAERYVDAWDRQRSALEDADDFTDLFEAISELRPHETHTSRTEGDVREGVVNVAAWFDRRGFTEPASKELSAVLNQQGQLPPIYLVMGRQAVASLDHPMHTMMTLTHEATHRRHKEVTYRLYMHWRRIEQPARTKDDFGSWLTTRRERGELGLLEYKVAYSEYMGSKSVSEVVAHTEGFMVGYPHLPVAVDPNTPAFHDLDAIDRYYWRNVGGAARPGNDVQRLIIGRLTQYARGLDTARLVALMAHLRSVSASNDFRKRLLKTLPG